MRDNETRNNNLPTINTDRVIQGEILRCVDGRWSPRDPSETSLLAIGTNEAVQCWRDGMPTDTIIKQPDEPLPDVDELNAQIPREEWEDGLDGQPRPPWQHVYIAYFVNTVDASVFTFINGTIGARIAVEKLQDRVKWMRTLRGANVAPLVRLDAKEMKTRFGTKMRPEFTVIEWREIGGGGGGLQNDPARQIEQKKSDPAAQVGKSVKPVTTGEALNDQIRF
jgi:hypothetical protein